jgi:pyrroline-5-carboxylate reductase
LGAAISRAAAADRAQTVGLIGTGHLAASLVTGWCLEGDGPQRIIVSPRNAGVAQGLSRAHARVTVAVDNQAVLDHAATVILCVRPQIADGVLRELRFAPDHRVLSVIATLGEERLLPLIAPATAVARAVPMPFAARRRGPLAVFPAPDWVIALLGPLGDVIAAPTAAAFNRFCGITATMAAFFRVQGTMSDWLIAGGVPPDLASRYVVGQVQALSGVPADEPALSDGGLRTDGGAIDFTQLAQRFATRGGINQQLTEQLQGAGAFDWLPAVLDQVLLRIEGRRLLPPDGVAQ